MSNYANDSNDLCYYSSFVLEDEIPSTDGWTD